MFDRLADPCRQVLVEILVFASFARNRKSPLVSIVHGDADVAIATVLGTTTVQGVNISFVPSDTIAINRRYVFVITKDVGSTSGFVLEKDFQSYFTSTYKPLYGGIISVRSRVGSFITDVTDDEIMFRLWRASIDTNDLVLTKNHSRRSTETLQEVIDYVLTVETWGVVKRTELLAAISILDREYYRLIRQAGRRTSIATFDTALDIEILPELREKIKDLKGELSDVDAIFFRNANRSRTTIPGQVWNPQGFRSTDTSWDRVERRNLWRDPGKVRRRNI